MSDVLLLSRFQFAITIFITFICTFDNRTCYFSSMYGNSIRPHIESNIPQNGKFLGNYLQLTS